MSTEFRSDRLIVKRNQGASSAEITSLQAAIGVTKVTTASEFGIEIWDIPPGKVEETISAYENDPRFEYIEPDYIITVEDVEKTSPTQEDLATITPQTTTPNDPYYPQLWGLNNTGQTGGTPDADIDAPEAWDIQRGDPNLVIGVIDTGVDYNHPDLVGNIWTNPGETAGNGIDDDGNGYIDDVRGWDFAYNDNDPSDVDGHGTHVSGTIAGRGDNGVGVTGVAWQGKILPIKFLNDSGSGSTSDAILAINYATANGVKITNNSWGGGGYSQGLYDAINTAGQQGALFIASAGNSGLNTDVWPAYPASYNLPNIISVAATDHNDALAGFSNYGANSVDLGAPGVNIYSTLPGGNYASYNGTSMASPHVAGGAALVWSQNPTWTAQQVKNRLLDTTDPKPSLSGITVSGGRLNVNNALGGSTPPPPPPPPPLVPNDNFGDRIVLSGLPVGTTGSNIGATAEPQEPGQSGPINSAWWSWTAPATETVNINTIGSNFDTYLSVFSGSALPNLTLLGANDDSGGTLASLVSLNAVAGTTYQIAVDGYSNRTGQIALNIVVPPPPNDNFANQIALTGSTATTTGSNRGATGEVGEPTQSGTTNSAWWYWTAPTTEIYNIDTRGSNFDTYLSVYEGSDLPNLTLISANDDGGGNLASLVSLNATAGTTYRLAVDGYASATGAIQLNLAPTTPPNDNFANAIGLTGDSANSTGTNIGATGEVGEPAQSGPINSAWWTWTPTTGGFFEVDTIGSGSDTYLSVFSGSALPNLTLLGANDDWGGTLASLVNVNATAGTTYPIAVDGWSSTTGPINLNIDPTAPPNDNFANRIGLTGSTANATGSNIRSTGEVGEPTQSGATNSVWWTWTAPTTENYTFDTRGSGFDTYLSLFTGSDLPNLSLVAANDDGGGNLTSLITQSVTAGTTYQIAVDGWASNRGPINLNIAPTAPPNDNFANRIALTGSTANATGSNIGASGEVGEPTQSGSTNSVWWTWTAPSTGTFTIDTRGSGYDTYLSLFTGSALPNLSLVAANDDGGGNLASLINLNAIGGQTYQIAVDGWANRTGLIQLNIAPTSGGAGNLTETANAADSIKDKDLADPSADNAANNTPKGGTGEDPLTGGTGEDSLMLPFAESSVSPRPPVTDLATSEKFDLLTQGGAAINAPSLFSPAGNSAVPTLEKDLSPVFTEPNGALAGNPPLGINSAPFGVANTSPFADPNLVDIYQAKQPLGI